MKHSKSKAVRRSKPATVAAVTSTPAQTPPAAASSDPDLGQDTRVKKHLRVAVKNMRSRLAIDRTNSSDSASLDCRWRFTLAGFAAAAARGLVTQAMSLQGKAIRFQDEQSILWEASELRISLRRLHRLGNPPATWPVKPEAFLCHAEESSLLNAIAFANSIDIALTTPLALASRTIRDCIGATDADVALWCRMSMDCLQRHDYFRTQTGWYVEQQTELLIRKMRLECEVADANERRIRGLPDGAAADARLLLGVESARPAGWPEDRCPVALPGDGRATIYGVPVDKKLAEKQLAVVALLVDAWPKGVSKGKFELAGIYHGPAVIRTLCKKPAWASVLHRPQTSHQEGYKIVHPPAA